MYLHVNRFNHLTHDRQFGFQLKVSFTNGKFEYEFIEADFIRFHVIHSVHEGGSLINVVLAFFHSISFGS